MSHSFERTFVVGQADCTPAGIVYYPNYFKWFEQSVWDLFHSLDLSIPLLEGRYGTNKLPLLNMNCTFHAACRVDDQVTLRTQITDAELETIVLQHTLMRRDVDLVVAIDTRVWEVRSKLQGVRRTKIPEDVVAILTR